MSAHRTLLKQNEQTYLILLAITSLRQLVFTRETVMNVDL